MIQISELSRLFQKAIQYRDESTMNRFRERQFALLSPERCRYVAQIKTA